MVSFTAPPPLSLPLPPSLSLSPATCADGALHFAMSEMDARHAVRAVQGIPAMAAIRQREPGHRSLQGSHWSALQAGEDVNCGVQTIKGRDDTMYG